MNLLSLIVAILPVFLIGLFIYKRDKAKDPTKFLFKLFMFGFVSCYPAIIIGSIFNIFFPEIENMNIIQLFIYVFIAIALVEELCKWFFVYKNTYNHNEFDSSYDMIVYASFVSLGFACFENLLYVSSYGVGTAFLRSISAVPGHACDGILMGIYLGIAKIKEVNGDVSSSKKYKLLSILIPAITHGIYDFCVLYGSTLFIVIFVLFVIIVDIYCFIKVIHISNNTIKFKNRNNYCVNCGNLVNSNFCTRCGNKNI